MWVSSARPAASCSSRRGRAEGPGGTRAGLTKAGRPASRHPNCHETARNARQTSQTERRRAGNSRPCLQIDSQLEPKSSQAPIGMPTSDLANEPDETRDRASATDDRNTRHPAAVSRAAARTAPSPSFHFSSTNERRREPPARATSRSTEDCEFRPALLAPAFDRTGHPTPRSRPPGEAENREQEPRRTFNVRRARLHHPNIVTWMLRSVEKFGWLVRLPSFTMC